MASSSQSSLRDFFEGFGGRVFLLCAVSLIGAITSMGVFFAMDVKDEVKAVKAQLSAAEKNVIETNGAKIGREEFERKLDKLSSDTRDHRAEVREGMGKIDARLQQVTDLLLSRYSKQTTLSNP